MGVEQADQWERMPAGAVRTGALAGDANVTYGPGEQTLNQLRYVSYAFVIPTIAAIGIIGNTLSLLVMCKVGRHSGGRKKDKFAMQLLMALASSDLAMCILVLPVAGVAEPMACSIGDSPTNPFLLYERFSPFALSSVLLLSTWIITLLSVNRYRNTFSSVGCSWCNQCGVRTSRLSVLKPAIIPTLVTSATVFNVPILFRSRIDGPLQLPLCGNVESYAVVVTEETSWDQAHWCAWALLGNVLPLIILLFTNGRIALRVRQLTKATQQERHRCVQIRDRLRMNACYNVRTVRCRIETCHDEHNGAGPPVSYSQVYCKVIGSLSPSSTQTELRHEYYNLMTRIQQRRRVNNAITRTLVWIVVAFMLLVAPSDVAKLVFRMLANSVDSGAQLAHNSTPANHWLMVAYALELSFNMTQVLNGALNFVIYYFANGAFRTDCKVLLQSTMTNMGLPCSECAQKALDTGRSCADVGNTISTAQSRLATGDANRRTSRLPERLKKNLLRSEKKKRWGGGQRLLGASPRSGGKKVAPVESKPSERRRSDQLSKSRSDTALLRAVNSRADHRRGSPRASRSFNHLPALRTIGRSCRAPTTDLQRRAKRVRIVLPNGRSPIIDIYRYLEAN